MRAGVGCRGWGSRDRVLRGNKLTKGSSGELTFFPFPIRIILIFVCRHDDDVRNGVNPKAEKRGVMGKVRDTRDGLSDRITQYHKDAGGREKNTSPRIEERRDQCIYRGNFMGSYARILPAFSMGW